MKVFAHKYRLYPTKAQQSFLNECFFACRFAWNRIHETTTMMYKWEGVQPTKTQIGRMLTEIANDPSFTFLKTPPKNSIEYVNRYYFDSWQSYWRKRKNGEIQALQSKYIQRMQSIGKSINYDVLNNIGKPNFKSLRDRQSFHIGCTTPKETSLPMPKFRGGALDYLNARLLIKKESIKIKLHRPIPEFARVKAVTVSKTKTGKYYAAFTIEVDEECCPQRDGIGSVLSIDAGVKGFYCSDGVFYAHPRPLLKMFNRLRFLQRRLSRSPKGCKGNNYEKKLLNVNKLHEKIANVRKDYLHKVSAEISKRPDIHTIAIERLSIQAMTEKIQAKSDGEKFLKNGRSQQKRDNRALMDSALYLFRQMLEYKGKRHGKNIVVLDEFEPTNKQCFKCKEVNDFVHFRLKSWVCNNCGAKNEKWPNSALVIKSKAVS